MGIRSALPPRVSVWWRTRGGCRKVCPSIFACALLGGGWGLETGGCGHPPLRGDGRGVLSTDSRRRSVGADALVGPRQLPRPAPAERERRGIRDLPEPEVSPRAPRLIKAATWNGQPSPAGGRRYAPCADRPAVAFFSFGPSTARFLFGKTEKKMGGALLPVTWHPRPNRTHFQ